MTVTSEILLFQVGPRVYAAAVRDAVRIGHVREEAAGALVVQTALGTPWARDRGIVVAASEGVQRTLVVDAVLGVRVVEDGDVRPVPPFAAACLGSGALTGFLMMDGAPTPVVDLPTLVREQPCAAPAPRPTERS